MTATATPTATDEYVVIDPNQDGYLDDFPADLLWSVTNGTRVRQAHGIHAGREGVIIGQARGREADRQFKVNQARAQAENRQLAGDDYGPLIDSEGPLVLMDSTSGEDIEWFPGQAMGVLEPADG